jgi:hypothetical protein
VRAASPAVSLTQFGQIALDRWGLQEPLYLPKGKAVLASLESSKPDPRILRVKDER